MTERARREYAEVLRAQYAVADKRQRSRILDEYCRTTGNHRKAAIRRLRRPARPAGRPPGRPRRYGVELLPVLERIWHASDHLCGKLLAPMITPLLTALERHHALAVPPAVRTALLTASPATLDRLSPPATSVRAQVPVRTWGEWIGVAPGAVQSDLVLHCGESAAGFYLASLVAVDVRHQLDGAAGRVGLALSPGHQRRAVPRPPLSVSAARVA